MNINDASQIIKTLFNNNVSVPAEYPNLPFDPPENEPYCRLRIDFLGRVQFEIGGPAKVNGACITEVFSPENTSIESHNALVESINAVFSDIDSGALRFEVGKIETLGRSSGTYRSKVVVPFFYVED